MAEGEEQIEKLYTFEMSLQATGRNPDIAWARAVEAFVQDPGPTPDDYEEDEIDDGE